MEEKKQLLIEIPLPSGIAADVKDNVVKISGKKGESMRNFNDKVVDIQLQEGKIKITSKKNNRHNKKQVKTKAAHIKNMIRGAQEGHVYLLKICSGHFPMTVTLSNNELIVKNFLGEKVPRTLPIKKGAAVKVEGDKITVESADLEIAGQVSAAIENLTRRPGFDTRIFQDGIYITSKDGKQIA
jgi:large subunit ribosomal protein L6